MHANSPQIVNLLRAFAFVATIVAAAFINGTACCIRTCRKILCKNFSFLIFFHDFKN